MEKTYIITESELRAFLESAFNYGKKYEQAEYSAHFAEIPNKLPSIHEYLKVDLSHLKEAQQK
jgi:hypothetical protein